jgi:drug/metabolite transporter (DMT)-like permease
VDGVALALVLASAVVHATWNLLLARAAGARAPTGPALLFGALALAPAAAATWRVDAAAIPWMAASAALEIAYFLALTAAYARADLSLVYPVARGTGPVLVLLVSVVALGIDLSAAAVLGVLLVGAGVVAVGDPRRPRRPADLALALAVGTCLAGYTLVDKEGLKHAAPLPYLAIILAVTAVAVLAVERRPAGGVATAATGVGMAGAYALTLGALARAPAAPVAAVRETSVVIATALAALVLKERVGKLRLAGAMVVVLGVGAIAFG